MSEIKPASQNAVTMPTWLAEHFRANPVSVAWQAIIGIGGVILTIHFAYIRFFPDLDWQSSVGLLAVVALTGLFIWSFICLLMVFPSYVWMMFLEDVGEKTDADVTPSSGRGDAAAVNGTRDAEEPTAPPTSLFRAGLLFILPLLVLCALIIVVLWAGWGVAFEYVASQTIIFIFTSLVASYFVFKFTDKSRALGPRFSRLSFWRYFGAVLFGSVVSAMPVMVTYAFVYSRYNPAPWKAMMFIVAIGLSFLYNLAALKRGLDDSPRRTGRSSFLGAMFVGAILLISVFALTGNWVLIPEGVASLYGIGNVKGATLLLDKEGCAIAENLELETEKKEGSEWCRLENINILNRLGATYYIETPDGTKFTLPSSSVRSREVP
jgi:hypothetical protein